MRCLFNFLQISSQLQSEFVMKAGLLVILLSGFIIYLTILHRYRKNRLYAEKRLQEERFNQELLQSKVEIQEATFTSVGIELHDNVGQLISSALMLVNMTERNVDNVPDTLLSAGEALNKSIIELRSLSKSLNKDWLEQFDLYDNLLTEVERINRGEQLRIIFDQPNGSNLLTAEQQFLLYRMIQEGIQNTIRHSGASELNITVKTNSREVIIEMKDNGRGFDTKHRSTGIGISNMQQRARSLGGSVKWLSDKNGTLVTIIVPLKTLNHAI